jgi:hypothetical protein
MSLASVLGTVFGRLARAGSARQAHANNYELGHGTPKICA